MSTQKLSTERQNSREGHAADPAEASSAAEKSDGMVAAATAAGPAEAAGTDKNREPTVADASAGEGTDHATPAEGERNFDAEEGASAKHANASASADVVSTPMAGGQGHDIDGSSGTPNADNRQKSWNPTSDGPAANPPSDATAPSEKHSPNEPAGKGGVHAEAPPIAAAAAAAAGPADGINADSGNTHNTRRRTRSLSSARSAASGQGSATRKQATGIESQQQSQKQPPAESGSPHRTRSRTRSLSSAFSSLSGGDGASDHGDAAFEDDGKTPRRTNRGPVRKRLKQKKRGPRALFPNEDATAAGAELPPLGPDGEGGPAVTFANTTATTRRARSNTIDSFRAAMDGGAALGLPDNDDDFPTEAIVLPQRREAGDDAGDDADRASVSIAKNVEDMIGGHSPPSSPRRGRLDTMDLLGSPGALLGSPRGQRRRSDTIDFLTRHLDEDIGTVDEDVHPTPVHLPKAGPTKRVEIQLGAEHHPSRTGEAKGIAYGKTPRKASQGGPIDDGKTPKITNRRVMDDDGKTPKVTNRSRGASHSSGSITAASSTGGPLRKRYRTRSLSFANSHQEGGSKSSHADPPPPEKQKKGSAGDGALDETNEGDNMAPTEGMDDDSAHSESDRLRANSLEYHDVFSSHQGRSRSDTLDFLHAAVAGDMGHDLDAALAAASGAEASFAMHPISAPSGASTKYNPRDRKRPRSNTLDSTASSINSAKLDFLVSVAAEQGPLVTSPVPSGHHRRDRAGSNAASETSSVENRPRGRPRSNTLEIYSNMASASRTRSDTVDFLMGAHEDHPMGDIDGVAFPGESHGGEEDHGSAPSGNVLDHLEALCGEPTKLDDGKAAAGILRRTRRTSSDMTPTAAEGGAAPRARAKSEEGSAAAASKDKRRKNSEATWKTSLSQEQTFMDSLTRNRLESWGGMSDLSAGAAGSTLAATHTALRDTGLLDDVLAAAADLGGSDMSSADGSGLERMRRMRAASGGSNSLNGLAPKGRPRKDSLASLSLASLSDTSISMGAPKDRSNSRDDGKATLAKTPAKEGKGRAAASHRHKPTKTSKPSKPLDPAKPSDVTSVSTPSIMVDYDAIASAVSAANAAVEGLDLAAILGTPTSGSKTSADGGAKAGKATPGQKSKLSGPQSAVKPARSGPTAQMRAPQKPQRVTSVPPIKAASQLQKTATGAVPDVTVSGAKTAPKAAAPFPPTSINIPFVPIPKSTKTKEELDAIRERARAAAGYIPPGEEGKVASRPPPPPPPPRRSAPPPPPPTAASRFGTHLQPPYRPHPGPPAHIPIKKRGLLPLPPNPHLKAMPDRIHSNGAAPPSYIRPPAPKSSYTPKSGTLQSQQKWDDMFDCLVKFIEETREKATKSMTEQKRSDWIWDGNVPTSYKTPCGKALGRWINNQRSAKAKGTLKDDREVRLVSTGLKWCVLTTNSWKQMLNELEIYVREQTKDGRAWDGNVPTNYKIKSSAPSSGGAEDEEKNLGRWVNRQRSLYQAGKLKKDRQEDLERIGLKWSVLLTTPWSTMYESLSEYAEEKKRQSPHGRWDGNVPANYKTKANPPLSLGRWVNRQRSAHAKGRLKEEYVRKLEDIGLKWAIHTSRAAMDDVGDDGVDNAAKLPEPIMSSTTVNMGGGNAQPSLVSSIAMPAVPPLSNALPNDV